MANVILLLQVVSDENQNLSVSSEKRILIDGHEGVFFDGKMLQFEAEQDVAISSRLVIYKFITWLS